VLPGYGLRGSLFPWRLAMLVLRFCWQSNTIGPACQRRKRWTRTRMSNTSKIWISVGLAGVVFVALTVLSLTRMRRFSRIPPCHENLVLTDLCKRDWAIDNSKASNDTPTWDDLRPYFPDWETKSVHWANGRPVCPEGGTYVIGRVCEAPRCSVGGYSHAVAP